MKHILRILKHVKHNPRPIEEGGGDATFYSITIDDKEIDSDFNYIETREKVDEDVKTLIASYQSHTTTEVVESIPFDEHA
jgi:hypothetical protein